MLYGDCPTWSAQFVTAGDANEEPFPAMLVPVTSSCSTTGGGVSDESGHVVVVVVGEDVVELPLLPASLPPAAAAGVPVAKSASSPAAPINAKVPRRWCAGRVELVEGRNGKKSFTDVGPFGSRLEQGIWSDGGHCDGTSSPPSIGSETTARRTDGASRPIRARGPG